MTLKVLTPYPVSNPFHSSHIELAIDDTFSVWHILRSKEHSAMQVSLALLVRVILRMMDADVSV